MTDFVELDVLGWILIIFIRVYDLNQPCGFHKFLNCINYRRYMWLIILLFISVAFIIITTSKLKWHPFFSLLVTAFGYGGLSGTMSLDEVVKSVNSGFGNTIGFIGIVILAGSIIGKFLEKSGGAFTLAGSTLKIVGKKNVPLALSIIGYIVSIPVFCDSGFIILAPLAKALTKTVKISFAIGAMALSLGLIVTHSIIPPTPGPVGAAGILNADLGLVILLGLPVSITGLIAGWFFSIKIASKIQIDPFPDSVIHRNKNTGQPSVVKVPSAYIYAHFTYYSPVSKLLCLQLRLAQEAFPHSLIFSDNRLLH